MLHKHKQLKAIIIESGDYKTFPSMQKALLDSAALHILRQACSATISAHIASIFPLTLPNAIFVTS